MKKVIACLLYTSFVPGTSNLMWAVVMSLLAFIIVMLNRYKVIENVNQVLILMMVFAFVLTAFTDVYKRQLITRMIPGENITMVHRQGGLVSWKVSM